MGVFAAIFSGVIDSCIVVTSILSLRPRRRTACGEANRALGAIPPRGARANEPRAVRPTARLVQFHRVGCIWGDYELDKIP
ncbi:hypothetical protein E2562_035671 [Oryza meyeriana var. granulata]|uniref:Uncharacterized protein n=1 Tax=Oryza meyeriana var. granulata TaxID=110450 RepID=A0A6G1E7W4_9ORYZ|nr:hypothetical protein E2562_035671 [Oryza meyeriana var. granulata]